MGIVELFEQYGPKYLESLLTTWAMTAVAFTVAMVIALAITVMRVSPIRPLRIVADLYVQIFRNIPGVSLLVIVVYALPYLDVMLDYRMCLMVTVILLVSAFGSENLMTGINTIGVGQIEAARALGLTFFQMIRRIIIPQSLRSSVLPMTNLAVATMLTTSLASQVPMRPRDLTGIVSYINTRAVGGVTAFAISAVLYCATALVIGRIGSLIDRKVRILR